MPSQGDLESIIRAALLRLRLNDSILLRPGQERAVVHRLAVYLEVPFSGWNVDVEYNREGIQDSQKHQSSGRVRIPDIIIHHRGARNVEDNLLIIEAKMGELDGGDLAKLKDFTSPPHGRREFQYQWGLGIGDLSQDSPSLEWYQNGCKVVGTVLG